MFEVGDDSDDDLKLRTPRSVVGNNLGGKCQNCILATISNLSWAPEAQREILRNLQNVPALTVSWQHNPILGRLWSSGDVDGDDLSLRPHSTLARVNLQLESGSQARARHSPFPILGQNGFHGLSLIELCNALKYNDNIMDIWSNDKTDKNDGFDHYVDDNDDDDDDEKEWSAGGNGKCSVKTENWQASEILPPALRKYI